HDQRQELQRLMRDRSKPLVIKARINLAETEKSYLLENKREIIEPYVWNSVAPNATDFGSIRRPTLARDIRVHAPAVEAKLQDEINRLEEDIKRDHFEASFTLYPNLEIEIPACPTLEYIFSIYDPSNVG